MNKEHLAHRKIIKSKKPKFRRQDIALKRLSEKWVRPKGLDSKRRLRKDGHQKRPSIGYSSPKSVRGLTSEGLVPILVNNVEDLNKVTKNHSAIIGRTVGTKKRITIVNKAKELKIAISNINTEELLKKAEEKKKQEKKKTVKTVTKKTETKEEKTDQKDAEEKLKEEKKKILENKGNIKQNY